MKSPIVKWPSRMLWAASSSTQPLAAAAMLMLVTARAEENIRSRIEAARRWSFSARSRPTTRSSAPASLIDCAAPKVSPMKLVTAAVASRAALR